jgi:hypothetical protein
LQEADKNPSMMFALHLSLNLGRWPLAWDAEVIP